MQSALTFEVCSNCLVLQLVAGLTFFSQALSAPFWVMCIRTYHPLVRLFDGRYGCYDCYYCYPRQSGFRVRRARRETADKKDHNARDAAARVLQTSVRRRIKRNREPWPNLFAIIARRRRQSGHGRVSPRVSWPCAVMSRRDRVVRHCEHCGTAVVVVLALPRLGRNVCNAA